MAHTDTEPTPEVVPDWRTNIAAAVANANKVWIAESLQHECEKLVTYKLRCERDGMTESAEAACDALRCVQQAIDHLSNA